MTTESCVSCGARYTVPDGTEQMDMRWLDGDDVCVVMADNVEVHRCGDGRT